MKCPKCDYLGFETGDRCRNCGYDFSLIADVEPDPVDIDLDLRTPGPEVQGPSAWLAEMDGVLAADRPAALPPAPVQGGPPLPLFGGGLDHDSDEPLIKLPATPRPPLAVRRTPATPRLRTTPSAAMRAAREPVLQFDEGRDRSQAASVDVPGPAPMTPAVPDGRSQVPAARGEASGAGVRLAAAGVDVLLLGVVDVAVIYLTLRIADLPMGAWTSLPPLPLLAFLLLVKWSYFCAFTALGGQTIGKMAFRLRVVAAAADDGRLETGRVARRVVVGSLSAALFGLGFVPAFFDPERRAFHDRVARTRVIALRSV